MADDSIHDCVLHCVKCKTFTKHIFEEQRAVSALTVEDVYRCLTCRTLRRFGLSVMVS